MASQSNMDRQFEEVIWNIFKMLFLFLKGVFIGITKLKKIPLWIGFATSLFIMYCSIQYKDRILQFAIEIDAPKMVGWMLYILLLLTPAFYLYVLGGSQDRLQKKYEQLFKDIGFVGKDGKYPYFCGGSKDGKKQLLTFKSNISLEEWRSAKGKLETALDYTIIRVEPGNSKKVVVLTVLPSDYDLPKKIEWEDSFASKKNGELVIGQSAFGNVMLNLDEVAHLIVAGETGSGKSVCLRNLLWQVVCQGARVFMTDFKGGVEFSKKYERFGEVITERKRAIEIFDMLINEMNYRLSIFRDMDVKKLTEYNKKTGQNLCRIVVFIDEAAQLMDKRGAPKAEKELFDALEGRISTLARESRAAGIHLVLGIQRPDANVLTGQIKSNIPARISGRFADKVASQIVLDVPDAANLPKTRGRFLYKEGADLIEFQAFYFDDDTMLHDLDVEVGEMLTQVTSYDAYKTNIWQSQCTKTAVKPEPTQKKASRFKRKEVQDKLLVNDTDAYPDWGMDEELPFPLDDEPTDQDIALDFDYN